MSQTPSLSEVALGAAIDAYAKDTGAERHQLDGWIESALTAAFVAASSTLTKPPTDHVVGSELRWICNPFDAYQHFTDDPHPYMIEFARGSWTLAIGDRFLGNLVSLKDAKQAAEKDRAALASVSTVNNPATLEKSDFQKFDVEGERQENERETTKQQSPSPIEREGRE